MNRKLFIQQSSMALVAGIVQPFSVCTNNFGNPSRLTILHTNDVHSRIEPFPMDAGRNAGLGGVAARANILQQIRNENEEVLLLDAGDMFQGTNFFNMFKGELEIKAMNEMKYDACTIGNHDFDAGIENLAIQLGKAKFPAIVCNYQFKETPMENKYVPFKIFNKHGVKIGVTGVGIELQGLVADNLYGKTKYINPIDSVNTTASFLKKQGCDLIICLSHLGDKYDDNKVSDEVLAKETYDVDLIIGGHTHRFFVEPKKYTNKKGGDTLVNQVGWGGVQMGRLDYFLENFSAKKTLKAHTVVIERKTRE